MTTDDLKDLPHLVILRTEAGDQVFDYSGPDGQVRAHEFAQKLMRERLDGCIIVGVHYRQIYSPQSAELCFGG